MLPRPQRHTAGLDAALTGRLPATWQPGAMENAYTHGHHESVLRSHRWRTAENSCGYLLPMLAPGLRLLDVGCGPGTITMDLAALLGPRGRVVALERTEEALDLARAEAATRDTRNVDFAVGDVTALDLPDDSFDVVHAHQVLQHVADPVLALREMGRVCRPGDSWRRVRATTAASSGT